MGNRITALLISAVAAVGLSVVPAASTAAADSTGQGQVTLYENHDWSGGTADYNPPSTSGGDLTIKGFSTEAAWNQTKYVVTLYTNSTCSGNAYATVNANGGTATFKRATIQCIRFAPVNLPQD
ncbi:peptidase inhibitor family I36 protein [Streptomyces rimosus]|uniref:peptidase inhibitor family I36 protein n=1 Tax=Streptomyces rimosus TaxID=1927 RepID=UPI000B169152|nr:peptidase inhibitor family I36 protein [Streptomyces rimosus]